MALTIDRNGYTRQEIIDALTAPNRTLDFRVDLLDSTNFIQLTSIDGVETCTVKLEDGQAIAGSCEMNIRRTLDGIRVVFGMQPNANAFLYVDMSSVGDYAIQSGDYLEYEIYWTKPGDLIAFELTAADGTTLRSLGAVDQNGVSSHPAADLSAYCFRTWYKRRIAIPAGMVGKVIALWVIACEHNGGTERTGYIRNMYITDSAGSIRFKVWSTEDPAPTFSISAQSPGSGNTYLFTKLFDFLNQRFRPVIKLKMPRAGNDLTEWAEFPQGIYKAEEVEEEVDANDSLLYKIKAFDLSQQLVDDKVTTRLTVLSGTNYITAVDTVLSGAAGGCPRLLTGTTQVLEQSRDWPEGTDRLQIATDLLRAANYYWYFDFDGVFHAEPWFDPDKVAPVYTYRDDGDSVMYHGARRRFDWFHVPNVVIVFISQPDKTSSIRKESRNTNPYSPTSIPARNGREIHHVEHLDAADGATAQAAANKILFEQSQIFWGDLETGIMPIHLVRDVIQIEYRSPIQLRQKFLIESWEYDLEPGARMKIKVKPIVPVIA